jgi:hypothetical protein
MEKLKARCPENGHFRLKIIFVQIMDFCDPSVFYLDMLLSKNNLEFRDFSGYYVLYCT